MRTFMIAAALTGGLASGAALAQTQPSAAPTPQGATPQNQTEFLNKTKNDPAFVGGEEPKQTGAASTAPAPQPREGMNYVPTKTPDETTQQPK